MIEISKLNNKDNIILIFSKYTKNPVNICYSDGINSAEEFRDHTISIIKKYGEVFYTFDFRDVKITAKYIQTIFDGIGKKFGSEFCLNNFIIIADEKVNNAIYNIIKKYDFNTNKNTVNEHVMEEINEKFHKITDKNNIINNEVVYNKENKVVYNKENKVEKNSFEDYVFIVGQDLYDNFSIYYKNSIGLHGFSTLNDLRNKYGYITFLINLDKNLNSYVNSCINKTDNYFYIDYLRNIIFNVLQEIFIMESQKVDLYDFENFDNVQRILKDISSLLIEKNKNYGDSYTTTRGKYGISAFAIRVEDKINRYNSLIKIKSEGTVDESILDTLKDIIGYAMLEIIYCLKKGYKRC